MNKFFLSALFLIMSQWAAAYTFFSPLLREEAFTIQEAVSEITLKSPPVIINTLTVWQDSLKLVQDVDYQIDWNSGQIRFISMITGNLRVEYSCYPQNLIRKYYYYQVQDYSDTLKINTNSPRSSFWNQKTKLNITGSKSISVSVSNDENLSIDQALFLKMDGELAENMNIQAQLSDSRSPVTPEGTSKELSSLDQMYIKIYGRQYELAFGDLESNLTGTKFMLLNPKYEGIKAAYFDKHEAEVSMAISKSKTATQIFAGVEGKQGPYYLQPEGIETNVQIIAGSEKIYLNGSEVERGADYTIDYQEGTITFTSKYFISYTSTIMAVFQYSDEAYQKYQYLADSKVNLTPWLSVKNSFFSLKDDKANPLLYNFTPEDKEILKNAGDGPAFGNGIVEVIPGFGQYKKVTTDSLIYYEFVGNDTTGNYNLFFTYVGTGKGDYLLAGPGRYEFVGLNQGDYLPIKDLPKPQSKLNYDLALSLNFKEHLLYSELLLSDYDKNTFSTKDDQDNGGYLTHTEYKYSPELDLIKMEGDVYYRAKSVHAFTFAELRDPDELYALSSQVNTDSLKYDEYYGSVNYDFRTWFQQKISVKKVNYADFGDKMSYRVENTLRQFKYSPRVYYLLMLAKLDYQNAIDSYEKADYQVFDISYAFPYWQNLFSYKRQQNMSQAVTDFGHRNETYNFQMNTLNLQKIQSKVFHTKEDVYLYNKKWSTQTRSNLSGANVFLNWSERMIQLDYTHKVLKSWTEDQNDSKYDMAEIHMSGNFWKNAFNTNLNYSLRNLEFYPKVRELQYVGDGNGGYDSTGVYVGDGDYEWETVNVGKSEMSIEVKTDAALYFNPVEIWGESNPDSYWNKLQTETFLQIGENSKSTKKMPVYLLNPNYLMNKDYTLLGKTSFKQTIWYDLLKRTLAVRLSYKKDNTLDNRYQDQARMKSYSFEQMLRLTKLRKADLEFTNELSNETDSKYQSVIKKNTQMLEMRNNLANSLIITSKLQRDHEKGDNEQAGREYLIDSYSFKEQGSFFFLNKYRLLSSIEIRNNKRTGSSFLSFIPEKRNGLAYKWMGNLNYKMNSYTTVYLDYTGNKYPLQRDIHQLKLEIRAEF